MKIFFIDPPGWQKGIPNVGLAYLAGALSNHGFEIIVLDANNGNFEVDQILEAIKDEKPDVIGYSVNTGTVFASVSLSKETKKHFPNILHVAGGPHISLYHKKFSSDNPQFDHVFLQEGENTFLNFCQKLAKEREGAQDESVADDRIVVSDKFPDPNKLPFPNFKDCKPSCSELLVNKYPLVTSRGCPYDCIFCTAENICGKKWRSRSIENIMEELCIAKQEFNIRQFDIVDDNFTLNLNRAKEFCRALIDCDMGLQLSCPNGIRADRIDEELIALMKKAGCQRVSLGIESGDREVFANVDKGESLEDIAKAISLFKKTCINVTGLFIIGLPGDTKAKFDKTIEFIKKTKLDDAKFGFLIPFQETKIYKWAKEHVRYIKDVDDASFFGNEAEPIYETDAFSREEMIDCYKKGCTLMRNYGRIIPADISPEDQDKLKLELLWNYDRIEYFYTRLRIIAKKILKPFHNS